MKEDNTLDLEASSRKLADAYTAAEKRIGSGDIPPKSAEEYTVTVPDAFKESFDPKADEGFKAFSGKMHALGLTQKQMAPDHGAKHYRVAAVSRRVACVSTQFLPRRFATHFSALGISAERPNVEGRSPVLYVNEPPMAMGLGF